MKPERQFVAERALAGHCAELVRQGPGLPELMARLEGAAGRLARALVPLLAPLAGGKGLMVKSRAVRETSELEFSLLIPSLAANTLFGVGAEALPLLVSIDAAAVLRMVDRTFGGRGAAPEVLPAEFPGSADRIIDRLEAMIHAELGAALALPVAVELAILRRAGVLDELAAFPGIDTLIMLEFQVTEAGGENWPITVALPPATLAGMFAGSARAPAPGKRRPADPLSQPFAEVPLECTAVLVDMAVSMKTLAALRAGTILPVSVARQVPLRVRDGAGEGPVIATGTVGAAEDRVALQIISAG